jgi:inorganic pyrophosphatase
MDDFSHQWQRNWANMINSNLDEYVAAAADCQPNSPEIKQVEMLNKLFDCEVPTSLPGFELSAEDSQVMHQNWKAGEQAAEEVKLCVHTSETRRTKR